MRSVNLTPSEHLEPKSATRYAGMLKQILLYDLGELTQLIDPIEQLRHLVRKYEDRVASP